MRPSGLVLVSSRDRLLAECTAGLIARRTGHPALAYNGDGIQTLALVAKDRPSTLLVLGDLARLSLPALAERVRRRRPEVTVVIVGEARTDNAYVFSMNSPPQEILSALDLPPRGDVDRDREPSEGPFLLQSLTTREREVLKLLGQGRTPEQIATRLDLRRHTVRTHVQRLYRKLGLHSRLDVVHFAARHGLADG